MQVTVEACGDGDVVLAKEKEDWLQACVIKQCVHTIINSLLIGCSLDTLSLVLLSKYKGCNMMSMMRYSEFFSTLSVCVCVCVCVCVYFVKFITYYS